MTPALCVSVHDISPATWRQCEALFAAVEQVGQIPLTLLLVPQGRATPPWYRNAVDQRLAAGDEAALHGCLQRDRGSPASGLRGRFLRRVYTPAEGEFAALSAPAAVRRLAAGREWFRANGWPLQGFVAPAWLLSPGAWQALAAAGDFAYTTSLTRFHVFAPRGSIRAPCTAFSAQRCNRGPQRANPDISEAPLARLALHPADARHGSTLLQAQRQLDQLLRRHQPMTKAHFAEALRRELAERGAAQSARAA